MGSGIARSSVFEGFYLAKEAVKGTRVAPNLRILCGDLDLDPVMAPIEVDASGAKSPVDQIFGIEHSKGTLKGHLCFNTINYLLSSGLCLAGIVPLAAGVNEWTFLPKVFGPDVYETYTLQKGSTAAAQEVSYAVVSGMSIDLSDKAADMSCDWLARTINDSVTLVEEASVENVDISSASPDSLDIYVADSIAGLDAGQLDDAFMAKWSFKDRFKPKMTLKRRAIQPSYKEVIEAKFGMAAQIVVEEDDTVAKAMMDDLRLRKKKFARYVATGSALDSTHNESISIVFPFKFKDNKRGDKDGSFAGTFDLLPIYDSGLGSSAQIKVVTALASLS